MTRPRVSLRSARIGPSLSRKSRATIWTFTKATVRARSCCVAAEHVSGDWLYDAGFAAAWVAEVDGCVAGHIAVAPGYGGSEIEAATGRPAAQTLGITRFFVGPEGRGTGAASALLDAVDQYAATHNLALALDVIDVNQSAIRLYERRGWRRIGAHQTDWFGADGPHPTVFVYVR